MHLTTFQSKSLKIVLVIPVSPSCIFTAILLVYLSAMCSAEGAFEVSVLSGRQPE